MKTFRLMHVFFLIGVLTCVGACGAATGRAGNVEQKIIVVTKADSGREIRVHTGDLIRVELEGQGGTGYSWYPETIDARHLEPVAHESKKIAGERIGGPVLLVWTYRVKEPGAAALKIDYYREWEGRKKAADHFVINIRIE